MNKIEFTRKRSEMYRYALRKYPNVRYEDIQAMQKHLKPEKHETILEVGAGSGFFSHAISEHCKKIIVSDPSHDQLVGVELDTVVSVPENIVLPKRSIDAIWSFGAMHHSFNKVASFKNFYQLMKPGGRVVIADVFSNSLLSKHFDLFVSRYCVTGHEVSFWSDSFVESVAALSSFKLVYIERLDQRWWFDSEMELGDFLYNLHGMTASTPRDCFESAKQVLGVGWENQKLFLNWPMKVFMLEKSI